MIEIFKSFSFDAAHHLAANVEAGHPNARLHGHSFTVTLHLRGEPDAKTGWLISFDDFDVILHDLREQLDHRYLNEIPGLEAPTLENLSVWIWKKAKPKLPLLARITIARGTRGEGCVYEGAGS
jgi:6-pyruvoyltetrahydropterin/6-carboxytetrahydropterin synthase